MAKPSVNVRFEDDQIRKLHRVAKFNGLPTVSAALRWIVERYPEPNGPETRIEVVEKRVTEVS